jgi:hypothetical protein
MDITRRYFAALYPARSIPKYLKACRVVVDRMTGNPWFPDLGDELADATAHLDDLEDAEVAADGGPRGAATKRNAALLVVQGDMSRLKCSVQIAADADLTHAQEIIESAGMYVTKRGRKPKPLLAVRYGGAPGLVLLTARAIKGQGSYQWQMSSDQVNWLDLPPTVVASTAVAGLTPATIYWFRFRTLTKAGYSAWSAPVSIIAH